MSIFKRKIKNTFDVAREVGVDESKIKELKEGDRHITGETMEKVLQSINRSQVERDVEKFNNVNKAIIKLYDFYHDDFNKKVEKDEVQIPVKKGKPLSCSKTKREEIMKWYSNIDIMALRGECSQQEISSLVGIPQSSWCALEKQPAVRCTKNIIKLYDYFHNDITAKDENRMEHNSKETKSVEENNLSFDKNVIVEDNDEKDLTNLSKYVNELENRIEEQNKEIDRLTRQVHCYEKLIDRL